MKNTLIVIGTQNKDKIMALRQALVAKGDGFSVKEYTPENQPDIRPVRHSEIISGVVKQTLELSQQYSKELWFNHENTITIGIQKGTNLFDFDFPPELSHAVAVHIPKQKRWIIMNSKENPPLDERVRHLVCVEKMDLYDAYAKVYGEKIKNKQIPLYEHLAQKSQVDWFAETVYETMNCL